MNDYVLVLKINGGFRIGRKRYNRADAIRRAEALRMTGINLEVMLEQKAFGI